MATLVTRRKKRRSPRVDIVSMIDVMFFLVVFFMLFSTFKVTNEGIPIDLPRAAASQEQPASELIVTITEDGALYLNDAMTNIDGLKQGVTRALANDSNLVVVIRADRDVRFDSVVTAMSALTEAGGPSLSITVERPSDA